MSLIKDYNDYLKLKDKLTDLRKNYPKIVKGLNDEQKAVVAMQGKKIAEIIEMYRFLEYQPQPKQKQFHCSDVKLRLLLGGNRGGKSYSAVHETIMRFTGIYPDWFPKECRSPLPSFGRVVVTDYEHGGAVLNNYMFKDNKLLPKELVKHIKYYKQIPIGISGSNGSYLEILSSDAEQKKHAGDKLHYVWIDEPVAQDIFSENKMRLIDYDGFLYMTMTVIKQSHMWVIDEIWDKRLEDDGVFAVNVHQDENEYLSNSAKKAALSGVADNEVQARRTGLPARLEGRVYKIWNPEVHIVDDFKIPKDWTLRMAIDPHDRKPFFMAWIATSPDGVNYIYRCYPQGSPMEIFYKIRSAEHSIKNYINLILTLESRIDGTMEDIYERFIDPNYGRRQGMVTHTSIQTELEEQSKYRLMFNSKINDDLHFGHLKTSEYLYYDNERQVDALNRPKLYCFRSCFNVWYAMQRYGWLEPSSIQEGHHGVGNRIEEKFKDPCDVVRYIVVGGLVPVEGQKIEKIIKPEYHSIGYYSEKREEKENGLEMKNYIGDNSSNYMKNYRV